MIPYNKQQNVVYFQMYYFFSTALHISEEEIFPFSFQVLGVVVSAAHCTNCFHVQTNPWLKHGNRDSGNWLHSTAKETESTQMEGSVKDEWITRQAEQPPSPEPLWVLINSWQIGRMFFWTTSRPPGKSWTFTESQGLLWKSCSQNLRMFVVSGVLLPKMAWVQRVLGVPPKIISSAPENC